MVSFWNNQKPPESSVLLCLGVLIRSDWILLTTNCAAKLDPFEDIVIEYGGYTIHNFITEESKITGKQSIDSSSKFTILHVSNSTFKEVKDNFESK